MTKEKIIPGILENTERVSFTATKRDLCIYNVWKQGKESGHFKGIKDFAKDIGMPENRLREIILAEEMKDEEENKICR